MGFHIWQVVPHLPLLPVTHFQPLSLVLNNWTRYPTEPALWIQGPLCNKGLS